MRKSKGSSKSRQNVGLFGVFDLHEEEIRVIKRTRTVERTRSIDRQRVAAVIPSSRADHESCLSDDGGDEGHGYDEERVTDDSILSDGTQRPEKKIRTHKSSRASSEQSDGKMRRVTMSKDPTNGTYSVEPNEEGRKRTRKSVQDSKSDDKRVQTAIIRRTGDSKSDDKRVRRSGRSGKTKSDPRVVSIEQKSRESNDRTAQLISSAAEVYTAKKQIELSGSKKKCKSTAEKTAKPDSRSDEKDSNPRGVRLETPKKKKSKVFDMGRLRTMMTRHQEGKARLKEKKDKERILKLKNRQHLSEESGDSKKIKRSGCRIC